MADELRDDEVRALYLGGTVPVPSPFPETGLITLCKDAVRPGLEIRRSTLRVTHTISAKLTITRTFLLEDVSAVCITEGADPTRGRWLLGPAIEKLMSCTQESCGKDGEPQRGIVYVREDAGTLMQVSVGMTAAESVDYYPPLPGDRSRNHYCVG
ncbi:MAG: hypothetical protein ACYC3X_11820 [Pirellulaceae bacterium]